MPRTILVALLPLALLACAPTAAPAPVDAPAPLAAEAEIAAAESAPLDGDWGAWNEPVEPFTIIGDIHYVGVAGVSAFLITTPEGHILIDGAFPQSAPHIIASIERLGFDIRDVKFILNSHAHIDHQGGLARLQRASGAAMVASARDRPYLEAGRIDYGPSAGMASPRVRVDRVIADGETVSLGGVTLTAIMTPGHTPGCTSWTMPVTGADAAAHTAFFHCSATVAGQSLAPEAYPGIVADFRATFDTVAAIEADILLANHGSLFGLEDRTARLRAGDANAFVDAEALQQLNTTLEHAFETELARQQGAAR